jgi:hypothetical protein
VQEPAAAVNGSRVAKKAAVERRAIVSLWGILGVTAKEREATAGSSCAVSPSLYTYTEINSFHHLLRIDYGSRASAPITFFADLLDRAGN